VNPDFTPAAPAAIAAAAQWIDATLLGTLATSAAVIAVACVGLLLLSGRIDVRRAVRVIFGCFILFGASSIAGGIMRTVARGNVPTENGAVAPSPLPAYPSAASRTAPSVSPYDPYAGAAMPSR
jgi:type IV secretion system protein VirB2